MLRRRQPAAATTARARGNTRLMSSMEQLVLTSTLITLARDSSIAQDM